MNQDGVLDGDGELERINDLYIQKKAVETYQCSGCVNGNDFKCFECTDEVVGIGCTKHCPGTLVMGTGYIFPGMPTGFNRLGPDPRQQETRIRLSIIKDYDDFIYDEFNIPSWKYKDEHGNILVRGLSPRINCNFLHVRLDDCFNKINCLEVTDEMIEGMD